MLATLICRLDQADTVKLKLHDSQSACSMLIQWNTMIIMRDGCSKEVWCMELKLSGCNKELEVAVLITQ